MLATSQRPTASELSHIQTLRDHSSVNHCASTRRFCSGSPPSGSSQPRPTMSSRAGVDLLALDEQALDFARAFLAELHRLQRHLPHECFAAALAEILDQRVVHVAAEQNRRAGADLQQSLDRVEVLQVLLIVQSRFGQFGAKRKRMSLLSSGSSSTAAAPARLDRRDRDLLVREGAGLLRALAGAADRRTARVDRVLISSCRRRRPPIDRSRRSCRRRRSRRRRTRGSPAGSRGGPSPARPAFAPRSHLNALPITSRCAPGLSRTMRLPSSRPSTRPATIFGFCLREAFVDDQDVGDDQQVRLVVSMCALPPLSSTTSVVFGAHVTQPAIVCRRSRRAGK